MSAWETFGGESLKETQTTALDALLALSQDSDGAMVSARAIADECGHTAAASAVFNISPFDIVDMYIGILVTEDGDLIVAGHTGAE